MWIFSKLDSGKMKAINELESKLGVTLIAFSDSDIKFATLDEDAKKEIQSLESELGLSLVALEAE